MEKAVKPNEYPNAKIGNKSEIESIDCSIDIIIKLPDKKVSETTKQSKKPNSKTISLF